MEWQGPHISLFNQFLSYVKGVHLLRIIAMSKYQQLSKCKNKTQKNTMFHLLLGKTSAPEHQHLEELTFFDRKGNLLCVSA